MASDCLNGQLSLALTRCFHTRAVQRAEARPFFFIGYIFVGVGPGRSATALREGKLYNDCCWLTLNANTESAKAFSTGACKMSK